MRQVDDDNDEEREGKTSKDMDIFSGVCLW